MAERKKGKYVFKTAGRPKGSPAEGFNHPKTEHLRARVTEGFNEVLELLAQDERSQSVVLHKALQYYAFSKTQTKELQEWINKII